MKTKQFIKDNKEKFLNELFELLKIQSVSVDPAYNKEVDKAADFLVKQFNLLKLDNVEKIKTEGHPIVYAEKILDNIEDKNVELCLTCNIERKLYMSEGKLICPRCGDEIFILIDSDKPSYKEPPREVSYFAYRRINHLNEFRHIDDDLMRMNNLICV